MDSASPFLSKFIPEEKLRDEPGFNSEILLLTPFARRSLRALALSFDFVDHPLRMLIASKRSSIVGSLLVVVVIKNFE